MKTAQMFIFIMAGFVLVQSFTLTHALKISDIEIKLLEDGAAIVRENITCENLTYIRIIIPTTIGKPSVYSDKQIEYNLSLMNDSEQIEFYSSKNITIEYKTNFFTEKKKDAWTLSFSLPVTPNLTAIKIFFPKNLKISFISETPSGLYVAENYQVVELKASKKEIDFACNYKVINVENAEGISAGNKTSNKTDTVKSDDSLETLLNPVGFITTAIIVLIILISSVSAVFLISKRKIKKEVIKDIEKPCNAVKESILNILDENEKMIVKMLEESSGEITQAYIYKTTKIPKASLSRKISGLEGRNIIECKKDGRINWIKLKDWVFKEQ